jgi:N-methylhydantoinase A/oxoprolinase/acetone carboxylase beta subunit
MIRYCLTKLTIIQEVLKPACVIRHPHMAFNLRVGVDVGGTNTDAVVMMNNKVLAFSKQPTTYPDVSPGIVSAIQSALERSGVAGADVKHCMIGTTHFINAIVQRRGLCRTIAVRLCRPATTSLPPLVDVPRELQQAICARSFMVSGGYEYDGRREIAALRSAELAEVAAAAVDVLQQQAAAEVAISITGVFSPVNSSQEVQAQRLIQQHLAQLGVEVSQVGWRLAGRHVHSS